MRRVRAQLKPWMWVGPPHHQQIHPLHRLGRESQIGPPFTGIPEARIPSAIASPIAPVFP
jgi:hypothetical protein